MLRRAKALSDAQIVRRPNRNRLTAPAVFVDDGRGAQFPIDRDRKAPVYGTYLRAPVTDVSRSDSPRTILQTLAETILVPEK